jgi:glucuronate isomerase
MNEDFLLTSVMAVELYHGTAKKLPIIDIHNHLYVNDLAENKTFPDICTLWLDSDPYKHRVMRQMGISESLITGRTVSPYERFQAWAETVPLLSGNPIFHWTELELNRVFEINEPLNSKTAKSIWEILGEKLVLPENSATGLLDKFNVEIACPATSLSDDLSPFKKITSKAKITPSLRCDDILSLDREWFENLGICENMASAAEVIDRKIGTMHDAGARFADISLDGGFRYAKENGNNDAIMSKFLAGKELKIEEVTLLKSALLRILADCFARRKWVMQLHVGAERYTSSRLRNLAGPAGGFAGIGHPCDMTSLCTMLDDFETSEAGLPQTVLYTLNPADNAAFAVLCGSYSEDGIPGKIQFGPAWWYNDHIYGMRNHFENLAVFGLLSTFIGMTTDSRSLLSFVRHEYYRRTLCGWLGRKVTDGEITSDKSILNDLVYRMCYGNIKNITERIK